MPLITNPTSHWTDEYWSLDGVSLHQYGWSVATVGGSRYDLPPRRGSNLTLANRPGQQFRPKQVDARPINLVMWLTGMNPATGLSTGDQVLQWNDSWDFLRRTVWRPMGAELTLARRWRLTMPDNGNAPGALPAGPQILFASTQVEVTGSMSPTMTGRTRADFTMDLLANQAFFFGPPVEATLNRGDYLDVWNDGHDSVIEHLQIDLVGPLTTPKLTNVTTVPNVWVQYNGVIAPGETVRLYVTTFEALQISANNANRIDKVTSGGAQHWFGLLPGLNGLTLTTGAPNSGYVVVRWQPPYV